MPVVVHIPTGLRHFTAGLGRIEITGAPATLSDLLLSLWDRYPGLRDRLLTEQGDVRQHVNIFVGAENARDLGGLAAIVADGSEISIVPAISGGSSLGYNRE